jgi:hypothetical protein
MLKWLRFSDAAKRIGRSFLNKSQDLERLSPILLYPPSEFVERGEVKFQVSIGLEKSRTFPFLLRLQSAGITVEKTMAPLPRRRHDGEYNAHQHETHRKRH